MKAVTRFFHSSDLVRTVLLLVTLILVNQVDSLFQLGEDYAYLASVLTTTSLVLVIAAVSHLLRRILFPYLDLSEMVRASEEDPLAAALVFLGVCIVMSVFAISNIILLN